MSSGEISNDEYDPEWLELETALGARPVLTGDIPVDKKIFDDMGVQLAQAWPKLDNEPEIQETTMLGTNVKIRMYCPRDAEGPLPVMVYFHGGGWVSGNLDTEDPQCRILAAKTRCILLSVDYPLAPPARLEEIIDIGVNSVEWAIENAKTFGNADTSKIIVTGGSAGGALAMQVVHDFIANQRPHASNIKGCMSLFGFCAPFDYSGPFSELFTAHKENAEGIPLIPHHILVGMYKTVQADFTSVRQFPLLAADDVLMKMPPVYFIAAEKDPCHGDAIVLEKRMQGLGVATKLDYFPGLPHYFHWFPQLNIAHKAMGDIVRGAQWLLAQ